MHDITPSLGQCGENRHLPSMNQSVKAGVHSLIVIYDLANYILSVRIANA